MPGANDDKTAVKPLDGKQSASAARDTVEPLIEQYLVGVEDLTFTPRARWRRAILGWERWRRERQIG